MSRFQLEAAQAADRVDPEAPANRGASASSEGVAQIDPVDLLPAGRVDPADPVDLLLEVRAHSAADAAVAERAAARARASNTNSFS